MNRMLLGTPQDHLAGMYIEYHYQKSIQIACFYGKLDHSPSPYLCSMASSPALRPAMLEANEKLMAKKQRVLEHFGDLTEHYFACRLPGGCKYQVFQGILSSEV
jgi:hypothetical protein